MVEDETETATFSVVGVERVLGRGDLIAMAIVSLVIAGVEMTLQGLQVRANGPDRVDVSLPTFKSTRDGTQKAAIVLPPELFDAIGMAVAQAFSALEKPTPTPEPVRDLLGASSLGSAKNGDYASRGR